MTCLFTGTLGTSWTTILKRGSPIANTVYIRYAGMNNFYNYIFNGIFFRFPFIWPIIPGSAGYP